MRTTEQPPIRATSDPEYKARIEAAQVAAEWRTPIPAKAKQEDIETLPLFGGRWVEQGELWS